MAASAPPTVLPQTMAITTDATSTAQPMDTQESPDNLVTVKQYLWKHPSRAGRITLYHTSEGAARTAVSFTHLADGEPIEDCPPHGSWEIQEKLLKVCFHHEAKPDKVEHHTFVRHDPNADVWFMTGTFEGWSASRFAFLQPWHDKSEANN